MNGALPTDALRDLHLPAAPGLWPLPPGWFIVAALVLLAGWLLWVKIIKIRRTTRWRRAALAEYQLLRAMPTDTAAQCFEKLQTCSILLRRIALAVQPKIDIAATTGEIWLRQLDAIGATESYSRGVGRLLLDGPYRNPYCQLDKPELGQSVEKLRKELQALLELVEATIRKGARSSLQ